MIKIGSLFAGIGGFERGLEMGIPNSETIWQVEQDKFCQKVLRKHWPKAKIYNDVREISSDNVDPVDLLCGGFPCQDISTCGKGEGLNGKKSGLWWEMHRIIRSLRPRVVVLENVPTITIRGGLEVIGSLTKLGYFCEWGIISARQFGAPHLRKRWFCVAYSDSSDATKRRTQEKSYKIGAGGEGDVHSTYKRRQGEDLHDPRFTDISSKSAYSDSSPSRQMRDRSKPDRSGEGDQSEILHKKREPYTERITKTNRLGITAYSDSSPLERDRMPVRLQEKNHISHSSTSTGEGQKCYWQKTQAPSPICRVDDGVSDRLHRLRALGNAIVPQCSEYIGRLIHKSGVLYA